MGGRGVVAEKRLWPLFFLIGIMVGG
jgi:hypothetical protein